ncbi:hypothetical protein AB0D42_18585 [Streptomyces sp. NPDC048304]|uniref:hypothetical protein n=1 Tax=Streptomyces sp. NPDC048304 TaxID=3154820 RepID=UPI0034024F8E
MKHRDLAWALKQQARRAGEQATTVRGSDWRLATVSAVGTDGTVTADGIKARRMETYQLPAVGDVIVISQSSSGNWIAHGRLSAGSDTGWVKPALVSGFAHDGNSNGDAQYRVVLVGGTRMMQWRGGIGITYTSNTIPNSGNILTTPLGASLRPPSRRSVTVACSTISSSALSLKVDFQTDGTVQIVGTTTSTSDTYSTPVIRPPWVSLNNIQYSLD